MKQATSFIPKSFPSLGDDVEDEDEAQPKSGGGSADPKPKVQSTLVPKSLFEYPDADHCAVLDAAAAFRRLAFKGCSAVRAAYSVLKLANTSNAKTIAIMFDLGDARSFPPQRAELHKRRYAGKALAFDEATDILRLLKCNKEDLPTYMITRPVLTRSDLDWNLLFMDKDLKLFTFSVFAVALQHAAATMFASGELLADATVSVWAPNGSCATITATSVKHSKVPASNSPLYCAFGEGDLRCYGFAVNALYKLKKPVVVHSIDTDFLLMTLASNAWMKPLPDSQPLYIILSESLYNANRLMKHFDPANECDKLNTAFWAMGFGTDYCFPLTTNGYFNGDLKKLLYPKGHGRKPISVISETEARFSLKQALLTLKPLKCNQKKISKDSLKITLLKMLFCLQYYGFMFVTDANPPTLYPDACMLEFQDTITFKFKPSTKALIS